MIVLFQAEFRFALSGQDSEQVPTEGEASITIQGNPRGDWKYVPLLLCVIMITECAI